MSFKDKAQGAADAVVILLCQGAAGAAFVWAADQRIDGTKSSWDDQVIWLALAALVVVVGSAARGWQLRERTTLVALATGVGGQLVFGGAVYALGDAIAAGRQNYWDAIHFSVLFWAFVVAAVSAFGANLVAARRGSRLGAGLLGISGLWVLVCLAVWTWTWSPMVQEWQGAIGRYFFLATHG